MERRQIINLARPTITTTTASRSHCTPFSLPSNGVLSVGDNIITLTSDAIFSPECTGTTSDIIVTNAGSPSTVYDLRDPFYASTIPECYALASATVIAYMLVIMLLITPRTFLHEGAVILGRRGFTNGPSGTDAGIGIGGRPWLQKVAALTVAISLTIATADTFKVAESQYEMGLMDAQALQTQVEDGTELKVIRVISDTFLWLAQAQTLIRLFPRQREKIIIKWTAFALISLDVLFSILNNWVYNGNSRPRTFVDAVPALAYLFQLALSLLYSAWVIYYSITKKRYAFYHPQMKNICLVALLSLVAVLVPTVFFVLDISKPTLAGWGDYVRWVGAAAASVVVWEWVERIEALERNEKKDGVLGREIFDGDEMLDATPSSDSSWADRDSRRKDDGNEGGGAEGTTVTNRRIWPGMSNFASRYRKRAGVSNDIELGGTEMPRNTTRRIPRPRPPLWPTRPPPAATPVSRTDTASAESTVYAIRYHPISEATPPVRPGVSRSNSLEASNARSTTGDGTEQLGKSVATEEGNEEARESNEDHHAAPWHAFAKANPFRRKTQAPPLEVSAHTMKVQDPSSCHDSSHRWDVRAKLENFAVAQADKLREKSRPSVNAAPLPRTVIPAPVRRRNLQATLEELENDERQNQPLPNPVAPEPAPNRTSPDAPNADDADASQQSRSQRLSDPYTPDDLNRRSIHQRGTLSFVAAAQQDRDRLAGIPDEPVSPVSPSSPTVDPRDRTPTISSRNSNVQIRTPTSPHGLPVHSIPAPPRRPRSDEDD